MYSPELLTYDLGPDVCAFSTGRNGGYSKGAYSSFNANAFCGDDEGAVRKNRELLCGTLGLDVPRLIIPHQIHRAEVRCIDEAFFMRTDEERTALLEGVDAVMTDLPHTCVSVSTADCIPVLIYDEAHHAVAAVHAGWRGTVLRVTQAVLRAMSEVYGTRPAEVKAVIGPGISFAAFEVGDEVYEEFYAAGFPMDKLAGRYPARRPDNVPVEKWHIDLWQANRGLLEEAGVPSCRIRLAGICTYSVPDRFFSARRLGVRSGRILNGIFLKDSLKNR